MQLSTLGPTYRGKDRGTVPRSQVQSIVRGNELLYHQEASSETTNSPNPCRYLGRIPHETQLVPTQQAWEDEVGFLLDAALDPGLRLIHGRTARPHLSNLAPLCLRLGLRHETTGVASRGPSSPHAPSGTEPVQIVDHGISVNLGISRKRTFLPGIWLR